MAIYALTSFSGAPGVTTTAVAWAYEATRPTLVLEASVEGGSPILAGVWDGQMPHTTSIMDLIHYPPDELHEHIMELAYVLPGRSDRWVLPTIGMQPQAVAMASMWPDIADALRRLSNNNIDVVIDVGRLGMSSGARTLFEAADVAAVLVDSSLQSIATAAANLKPLRDAFANTGPTERLVVVTVEGGRNADRLRPYGLTELRAAFAPVKVAGSLPHDPVAASVYSNARAPKRSWGSRAYPTAVRSLADELRKHHQTLTEDLDVRSAS